MMRRTIEAYFVCSVACAFLLLPVAVQAQAQTQIINTVAGNGSSGFSGDGGPATSAQLFQPSGSAVDIAGNLFIADSNNEVVREVFCVAAGIACTAPTGRKAGDITTLAGTPGVCGFTGDGGPATSAQLCFPFDTFGLAVDTTGNLFIPDSGNNEIREIFCVGASASPCTPPAGLAAGDIATVAGSSLSGFSGDGGPATSALLSNPTGILLDASGNLFIADGFNNVIREVFCAGTAATACTPPSGFHAGDITTVAGTPGGVGGFSGDGGPATSAQLNFPQMVAVDAAGNLFIADFLNSVIREVFCVAAATVACSPPVGLNARDIATVAGTPGIGYSGDGGPATKAKLSNPSGEAVDPAGNLIIVDQGNGVVREVFCIGVGVSACTPPSGLAALDINTVAGNGMFGFSGDGGPATSAALNLPTGVATDSSGNWFIADLENNRVREVTAPTQAVMLSPASLNFGDEVIGTTSAQQPITLTNSGNAALTITSITASSGFTQSNNCPASPATLTAGANCTIMVAFAPTSPGPTSGALISVSDNATGTPQTVALSGTGVDFSISAAPGSFTLSPGGTATYTLNLAPAGDVSFPNLVDLTATGAPSGAVVSFSQSSVSLGEGPNTSTLTITVPTALPSAAIASNPRSPAGPHPVVPFPGAHRALLLTLMVASAISLILALRLAPAIGLRRLLPVSRFVLLCALLCALGEFMAGCEGGYPAPQSVPAATTFTITITGTSSPLQHSTTVTLIVKQ